MDPSRRNRTFPAVFSWRAAGWVLAFLSLAHGSVAGAQQAGPMLGHWEGALHLHGAEMPVRIHVESVDGSLQAKLDIPSLVMAWEPLPISLVEQGIELEFPFGLGVLSVVRKGEEVHATRGDGEQRLELHLKRAAPPPFTRQEIRFESDGIELVGTLVVPQGEGPHPAVVLLHGSGRQGREQWAYRSWADLLARQGLVVLYYDKRGIGASGGEYGAGLRQLANDGLAAVRTLRSRPEVDPRRILLKGSSQGAWLAEQVAADLGDLAGLLLISAAAGTPRDQEFQQIEYGMRDDDRSEAEIENALAYTGLYFYVARTGNGWPLLEKAVQQAQAEEWGQYVDQPRSQADLAWWHENHALQPAELVKALDLPVLLLYGGADWVAPPVENAHKLRSLFPSSQRVEVHVFPGGDHRLELDPGRDAQGIWHWPRMAPAMSQVVAEWLEKSGLR